MQWPGVEEVVDHLVRRFAALTVEEDAVAFDVRELPWVSIAAKDGVQEVFGDLLTVLDANVVEK